MSKFIAWSHSRIEQFRKCARQFYEMVVVKRVKFEQSAQMLDGERQHKMLENRVSSGTPIPEQYKHLEPIAQSIIAAPGRTFTEYKMALNSDLKPCGYKDWDNAYVRVVADVVKLLPTRAFVGDYKTGTPRFDEDQLKLSAAVSMETFPEVDTVTTAYIWTKNGLIEPKTYTRDQLAQMWDYILVWPRKLQEAYVMDQWKAQPGKHCRWCLVNRAGLCDKAAERYRP